MTHYIANEVVLSFDQLDVVIPCPIDLGSPWSGATIVAIAVNRHHIVDRRIVLEHWTYNHNGALLLANNIFELSKKKRA